MTATTITTAKSNLFNQVDKLTANDTKLRESYNERTRRGQAFTADLTKYDAKQQETVKRAIESGILNNTNRTHEFVDLIAKISANKGVSFNFADNAKLKESGFAIDGKQVNGFVTADGVTININSAKALNSVVGHEITHVLEGTELYNELQSAITEYAKSKGDYQGRFDALTELYKDIEGADIDTELTADLVGDYLFTDADFVKRLSTEHRGVFQKLFDEIKHLCKLATAGTKEARELEKVKKLFEDAYRTETKNPTADGGVKYSLGDIVGVSGKNYGVGVHLDSTLLSNLTEDERIDMVKEYVKELGGSVFTAYDNNNAIDVHLVKWGKKFKNKGGKMVPVNKDLTSYLKNEVKQEAIVLVDELILASTYRGTEPASHPHDWVDNNGQNDWDVWNIYIQDKQNTVWEASLRIANSTNGEKILYDIYPIKKVEGAGTSAATTTNNNIASTPPNVNRQNSLSEENASNNIAPMPGNFYGKDVVLEEIGAPTREDIARMEQEIATAPAALRDDNGVQDAPDIDVEELGAPTREDIARMEQDKKLKGPLLMKDSLDRELEKLYRLQQTGQIQDDAYFLELFKVNAAYQAAGLDFPEAFNRVIGAYQTETVAGTEAGKTNAVTKPLSSYPAEKQNAIRSYLQSVDEQIKSFVKRVKGGDLRFERKKVSDVNERAASDIQELLGIDVSGYTHNINTSGVQHILRRHGKNGKQDSTMSVDDDIARVGWVLDNYDSVELLTKDGEQVYSSEFKDKDNKPVPQIRFIKKIDGTYYVVEAACENEYQKLWVQSAYLQKNEDVTQVSAEGQEANHKTYAQGELASPSSDNSIFQNSDDVKYSLDQSVAEELGAPTREDIARMEAEKDLHGPWRMEDPLDQKVEKLYRMMLREEVSEEDYIAQLVKADRQYQQRGSKVEEALERVREAYSKETTETPETEKKMERLTRKVLHKGIMDRIRDALTKAGFDLNAVLKNAKKLSTFATVDNTPQRVNEKTFGYKAGQVINDLTINKAALNESDGIQWLNGQIAKIKKLSKRYGIKPGSKESRAAQIYGEGFWVNEVGEYIQYGDAELAADFPDTEKQAKIKALAKSQEVRQMYDDALDAINAARVRNGYPPIPRRDNYFLHYRAQDDTFSKIGVPFNPNDVRAKDLPTDLNGVTADVKPGKPFFASEMHRTDDKTTYDLLGGLERYMNSAKNQIYHIDDIQTFRAMRNYIADMFGQANGLADLDSLSPEEQEQRIKEVFDKHLSTYAKFLNEEANIFAGKTALIDRGVEGVLGRRAIQFLHTLNGQVGKNMVGYNISSAGTKVLPVVQAIAKLPKVGAHLYSCGVGCLRCRV